jgi:hypothetical protein
MWSVVEGSSDVTSPSAASLEVQWRPSGSEIRLRHTTVGDRHRPRIGRFLLIGMLLVASATLVGNEARAQRVPNYYSTPGLTFYYVEPSYATGTAVGPGFLIPPLYAANAAWNVQDVRTRIEFYNAGGSGLPMHVQAQDTLGGPIADATTGCAGTTAGSCLLRFARGTFWYNGTGTLPAGATDFISVALHEFGHLVGLGHSESQLQSEVAGEWFTGPPAVGPEGANIVRRAVHIDDVRGARIARPALSGDAYNMLANGTFDDAIPYGPYGSASSFITGWAFSDQGQPGAAYFPYPGGYGSATYMAFVSRTGANASAIYEDFFFEGTVVDGTPPTYMRTSDNAHVNLLRVAH